VSETPPADGQRIAWKRLFAEVVAIVISILFAFSIDAWWQARGERELEVQHLLALRGSVTATIADLHEGQEQSGQNLRLLEEFADDPGMLTDLPIAQADSLIYEGVFRIVGGWSGHITAFDDLKTSGQLSLIGSPELRLALQEVDARAEGLIVNFAGLTRMQENMLDPIIAARTNLFQLRRGWGADSTTVTVSPRDHRRLLESLRDRQSLLDELARVSELVDERLRALGRTPPADTSSAR